MKSESEKECRGCAPHSTDAERKVKWLRIAIGLVGGAMLYNIVEAGVASVAGREAGSIALLGFGLDSVIECAAAAVMLMHLVSQLRGGDAKGFERRERSVRRFIGATFIGLALYIVLDEVWMFWKRQAPEKTSVGILLAFASLVIMPAISWGKLRAARELGSRALRAEAKETLVCSYLSLSLLIGLGLNAMAGWWWADPAAAVLMVPWLVKEGIEGVRGDDCCDDD